METFKRDSRIHFSVSLEHDGAKGERRGEGGEGADQHVQAFLGLDFISRAVPQARGESRVELAASRSDDATDYNTSASKGPCLIIRDSKVFASDVLL